MERKLADHPRLHISREDLDRLKTQPRLELLRRCRAHVEERANHWVGLPPMEYPRNVQNELLLRAREMQTRVLTLAARFLASGRETFRRAVLEHIAWMRDWEYWSWLAMRSGDSSPEAIYDLSYGENATTLALAFDWLHDHLDDNDRQLFIDTARKWVVPSALVNAAPGASHWFGRPDSNWNTVCAGGLGMLCLSMHEHLDEADKLLEWVEQSIEPFFQRLDDGQGGWPEGIGYWNYGMRYGFMYLLGHTAATGRKHKHLGRPGLEATMGFPLELTPWGHAASFGDVNRWRPMPVHYRMAETLGRRDVTARLTRRALEQTTGGDGPWPHELEWLLVHPGTEPAEPQPEEPATRFWRGLDWAVLADRLPEPTVYVSVRGGTTEVSHAHLDLLSYHAVLDGVHAVQNLGPVEYLDSTFSPRRYDLPEINSQQKNTILINGVGIERGSSLDVTEPVIVDGHPGIRMEATSAFGTQRGAGDVVSFCGRLIVRLADRGILVVDRVMTPNPARVESRLHTRCSVRASDDGFVLEGGGKTMQAAYVSDVPAVLRAGGTCPTTPKDNPAMVLRYITEPLCRGCTLVTLLARGATAPRLALQRGEGLLQVMVQVDDFDAELKMDDRLNVGGLA